MNDLFKALLRLALLSVPLSCGGAPTAPAPIALIPVSSQEGGNPSGTPSHVVELELPSKATMDEHHLAALARQLEQLPQRPDAMDVPGDPNHRPIRVWSVSDSDGVKAIHVIGHADGECCPIVSGALQAVVDSPGFADDWLSYGYGRIEANDAGQAKALATLRAELEKEAGKAPCKGQLHVKNSVGTDPLVAGAKALLETGQMAWTQAERLHRPIVIWHDFGDIPRIVPALVKNGTTLAPLQIVIAKKDIKFPAALVRKLSLDGIDQAIASVRQNIRILQEAIAQHERPSEIITMLFTANYLNPTMVPSIEEANSRLDGAIAALSKKGVTDSFLDDLRAARRANEGSLQRVRALPAIPTTKFPTRITYNDVDSGTGPAAPTEWKEALKKNQKALASLQKRRAKPKSRPEPILLDALLRGWPASFSDAQTEKEFDTWVGQHQVPTWKSIQGQLSEQHLTVTPELSGAVRELALSNVVFTVAMQNKDFVITPQFILAGAVAQIVDPDSGLVRYESMAADQNLLSDWGG